MELIGDISMVYYYKACLEPAIQERRSGRNHRVILQHDNTRPYTAKQSKKHEYVSSEAEKFLVKAEDKDLV